MPDKAEKRYILTPESGSVQYDIDHDTQKISLKVDIEKLSAELMEDDIFKNAIIAAVAKQLTGSDETADLTSAIGETAINAAIADLVDANTNNNADWGAAKDVNSLYTAIISTVMSNNPTSNTDTATGKGYTPLIVHGTSVPDASTIEQYPGAYIYIQHD